jgi:hypothetical protein
MAKAISLRPVQKPVEQRLPSRHFPLFSPVTAPRAIARRIHPADLFLGKPVDLTCASSAYVRRAIVEAVGEDVFMLRIREFEQGRKIPAPRFGLSFFRAVANGL